MIAAHIGGLSEVVGEPGLRFTPGDANALAACMRQVLERPELRAAFGERARLQAQWLFALERMIDDHLELFQSVHRRDVRSSGTTRCSCWPRRLSREG